VAEQKEVWTKTKKIWTKFKEKDLPYLKLQFIVCLYLQLIIAPERAFYERRDISKGIGFRRVHNRIGEEPLWKRIS
jgi:hypothetical protein